MNIVPHFTLGDVLVLWCLMQAMDLAVALAWLVVSWLWRALFQ